MGNKSAILTALKLSGLATQEDVDRMKNDSFEGVMSAAIVAILAKIAELQARQKIDTSEVNEMYSNEQLRLAFERGAFVEKYDPLMDAWGKANLDDINDAWELRLASPEKDSELVRFDLYPFELKRVLSGETCVDERGREWLRTIKRGEREKEKTYYLVAMQRQDLDDWAYFNIDGKWGANGTNQLYMKFKPN